MTIEEIKQWGNCHDITAYDGTQLSAIDYSDHHSLPNLFYALRFEGPLVGIVEMWKTSLKAVIRGANARGIPEAADFAREYHQDGGKLFLIKKDVGLPHVVSRVVEQDDKLVSGVGTLLQKKIDYSVER